MEVKQHAPTRLIHSPLSEVLHPTVLARSFDLIGPQFGLAELWTTPPSPISLPYMPLIPTPIHRVRPDWRLDSTFIRQLA